MASAQHPKAHRGIRGRRATVDGRWDGGNRRRGALVGRRLSPHRRHRVWSAVANGSALTAAGPRHRLIDHGARTLPSLSGHTPFSRICTKTRAHAHASYTTPSLIRTAGDELSPWISLSVFASPVYAAVVVAALFISYNNIIIITSPALFNIVVAYRHYHHRHIRYSLFFIPLPGPCFVHRIVTTRTVVYRILGRTRSQ